MFKSAENWRERADEVRAIRDTTTSEKPRRILAQIADDHDRLSKDAKTKGTRRRRS
jgi:hypothetical protein